jgi:hypothetical protein
MIIVPLRVPGRTFRRWKMLLYRQWRLETRMWVQVAAWRQIGAKWGLHGAP